MNIYDGVLLSNAYEAWALAIKYANEIMDGMITLQKRKAFVSNLHNAVELFLKQIMINNNDHRVATVRNNKLDKDGQPLKEYYLNNHLNDFFMNLNEADSAKFISIEFFELIDLHTKLLGDCLDEGHSFTVELKKIQELRNSETHFAINDNLFLNETEFVLLYNFMINFFGILSNLNLLPLFSTPIQDTTTLYFNKSKLVSVSYKNLLKNSSIANKIKEIVNGELFKDLPSFFDIASCNEEKFKIEGISLDAAVSYLKGMFDFNIITVNEEYGPVEKSNGDFDIDFIGFKVVNVE